ncbi:MAG: response regulator [Acidobacteria bacterium]|nr:response regulator [Acidobacteriota bacterium]MBV9474754.1 response regulator [Acidobacteriota bacterium]
MSDVVIDPGELERVRRERAWRLAAIELPRLRAVGSVFLAVAVYLHNHYLLRGDGWVLASIALAVYAAGSWLAILAGLRRGRDLTLPVLVGDLVVWTFAIACSGHETSLLFFVLLLRVADQTQTTFRRAISFALFADILYCAMLAIAAASRPLNMPVAMTKLAFLVFAGVYIALAARTAESRRAQLTSAVRMSRDLIKRLEQQSAELREAHLRAQEASAAKSEFLANMSHEMRTPLQAVIGMLQLTAADEASSPSRARRLDIAHRSARALLGMIDDVLDFSRIEARKLELEPVYFPLRQLMSETMKSLGGIAASKRLTLSYSVSAEVPEVVWGDPLRLRQILVNLVGNAIKFTQEGEIAVRVACAGTLGPRNNIRFEVHDTGIGIAPSLRQKIFEPFAQADSSASRNYGGAGLGLSIVARLLEAMGGSVDVRSEQGAGSVFSFIVPLITDAVGVAPQRRAWESGLAGRSVLIVEPATMARATLAEILRSRGVFASAFARASDAPAGRFACAVTADPTVDVQPQVVITSPLEPSDAPNQVMRPVGERELIDAVGLALGLTDAPAEYTLATAIRANAPLHVMLVDDNEVNREVVAELLGRIGHTVSVAVDGEEALALLAAQSFDVVLMDVQLPGIDGLEATRRARGRGDRTPIIALTAHSSREDRDRCLVSGMNGVLVKPVDAPQLAEAIAAATAREALLDVVGGNPALLEKVRDAFARQTPELLAAIHDAIARNDATEAAKLAHKLKGSVSHFPREQAVALSRELEQAARGGELARAAQLLPELACAIEELREALARA